MQPIFRPILTAILTLAISATVCAQGIKPGKHMMSLQWLWNQYGSIQISSVDSQGWQRAKGEMHTKEGFLQIDGKLKQTAPRQLQFEGLIRSQATAINEGKVCERNGTYQFLATGKRKYWRLQEMENCEGGNVVDYIDIYF